MHPLILDTTFIENLYGQFPDLSHVELHEAVLHRDGPAVRLRLELPHFPAVVPEKWKHFNTVMLELEATGVTEFAFSGLNTDMICSASIQGSPRHVVVEIHGGPAARIVAEFVRVYKVSAYRKDVTRF